MVEVSTTGRCRSPWNGFGSVKLGQIRQFFVVGLLAGLCACATPSPPGEVAAISVSQIQSGEAEKGAPVRWGGTVAKVHNKSDKTVLEVVSRPLLRTGRPKHNDSTDGRFFAEISGFLDPEIVKAGRDISVIGTVVRIDDGLVGEAEYRYPVLSVFDYRVWKKRSEINDAAAYPHFFVFDRPWHDWPYRRRSRVFGGARF